MMMCHERWYLEVIRYVQDIYTHIYLSVLFLVQKPYPLLPQLEFLNLTACRLRIVVDPEYVFRY